MYVYIYVIYIFTYLYFFKVFICSMHIPRVNTTFTLSLAYFLGGGEYAVYF